MQTHIHKGIKSWMQKTATWLAILAIVLPVNILSAIKVEAVTSTIYVDDSNSGSEDGSSSNPYNTIQEGISASSSGDTISVAAGSYIESPIIDKTLTVTGAGQTQTFITPTANSDGVTISANSVTLQDVAVQTSNVLSTPNIAVKITATSGVTLTNDTITTTGDKAMGVWVGGSSNGISPTSNLSITKSTITINGVASGIYGSETNPAHSGWTIGGSALNVNTITASVGNPIELYDVTNSTVSYNTLNATSESSIIWSSELSDISNVTVSNNTFNGSGGSELAILNDFPTNTAPATTVTTVNVSNNTFNTWGSRAVRIGSGVTGATLTGNQFLKSPVGEAVKNENTSTTVTATQNWWGSTSGPSHSTNATGTGNSVTDFVTFRPWCNSSACTSNDSTAPTATLTYSKDGGTTYTTSSAVKDADTLKVKATFNENIEDVTGAMVAIDNSILSATAMAKTSGTVYTYDLNVPTGNIASATVSLSNVYDTSGNALSASPTNNTFTVDNTNPGLATGIIEDMNSDATDDDVANTKQVRISWNASSESGSGISHYLLRVRQNSSSGTIVSGLDDINIGNVTTYTLTSGQGDLITSDGFYVFGLRAVDNAGNMSASYAYSDGITIDTSVPTVNAGTDKTTNAIFTQDATVNGAVAGVASYQWSKQTGPGTITYGSPTTEDTTISANQDGTYTIRLTVVDNAGNTANDEMSLIWDTVNPASTVTTSGTYGPNTWGGNVAGTASDTNGIASVNVKIINPSGNIFNGTTFVPSGAGVTATGTTSWTSAITSAQLTTGGQGVYTIESRATDNAGNTESTGTSTITWDSISPNTPVINTVTSPVNSASQTVTGTAESGSTVTITGGSATASGAATGGNYSISVSLTQDATNNLSVTATDAASNISSPATTSIVEDSIAPSAPDNVKTVVSPAAPGSPDVINGQAGAVEANSTVKLWSNVGLTTQIGSNISAGSDGSFAITSIGDNTNSTIYVTATDATGNQSTATSKSNDISYPDIIDITGSVSITTGESTTIAVLTSDTLGVTSARIYIDGVATDLAMTVDPGNANRYTYSYGAPSNSVASHNYYIRVFDSAGNARISSTYTITVTDNDNPTIDSITGTVGTTGDTTTVTVNASDNIAPTSAQISVNSGAYTAMTGSSSPFTYGVAVPAGSTSSITYTVKVFDATTNNVTSGTQTITVTDNDVPVINSILSSPNTTGETSTITVSGTDNISVASAQINYDGAGFVAMTGSGPYTYDVAVPLNSLTTHSYVVKLTDGAGNITTSSAQTLTPVDNDAPSSVGITGFAGTTGETTTVTVTASDNIAPTSAQISVNSGAYTAMTGSSSPFTYGVVVPAGSTSSITYTVKVFDAAGNNTTSSTQTIIVTDNDNPTIDSITGTNGTTGETTSVTVTTSDNIAPTSATISINGGLPVVLTGSASPFTYGEAVSPDSTDNIIYTVKVFDGAGNNTTSSTQTIIVTDNDAPTTPTISINTGATYTNQLLSSLALSATDNIGVTQVRFNESPTLTGATYVAIASPLGYTLSSGDGTKTVYAQFKDSAGNESDIISDTIVLDQTAPALIVESPIDGQVFKNDSPIASYSATDANGIVGYEVSVDGIVIREHISGSTLGTLADGDHTVIIKATDNAGNETSETRTITINSLLTSEPLTTQFTGVQSDQTINDIANTGIELSGINTTGDVTISIGEYTSNPTSAGITGLQAFGKYFDVSVSESTNVTFPMMVKIYYTNADLAGAGITEDKLDGIYFYNTVSGAWERYGDSGVQTADLVADGISFAGYVWANVNHLTPIVAASDTTAPVYPTNVTTSAGDSTLTVSWDAVSGASGYTVRWRPATATNTGGYTYATTSSTNYTIVGLNNTWLYEIGVASTDSHGNMSDFTVVSASPIPVIAPVVQETQSTPAVVLASTQETTVSDVPAQPVTQKSEVTTPVEVSTPTDDTGVIKGSETSEESGSQAVVVFAILLLALAAGIGGYYGYEWFVQRSTPDGGPIFDAKSKKGSGTVESKPQRGRPKKNDARRDGRW